jgi:EAL domain-containing protein (putative c-di-GMP-specific phosphodiesterase class I)
LLLEAGVQIAIDDFGTGYSSLAYLKRFQVAYLKIDRSFIRNLAPGNEDHTLCEAMITMAHRLGIKVIAEGVESPQQRELLRGAACDMAQGYLYAQALPLAELVGMLRKQAAGAVLF